ncbi:hypothetical protein EDD86DRAFT_212944 [Gorgonomyces haynaldii]|nr:hypothetical protein EDD86DRAFT_212944 [Gorgonomyces haynaldii]
MTTAPNSGFYLYPSAVFHGLAVHEFASCAYLLFKRLSDDFKVIKTPLFYLSCLALIANVIDLVAYSLALQFLIIPKSLAEYSSPYYVRVLNMCVFAYQIPQLFNHAVILLRILGVHEQKSGQFLFLAFLAISHLLVVLIAWFYGYIATQRSLG